MKSARGVSKNLFVFLSTLLVFFFPLYLFAQTPNEFNYQAVARNGDAVLNDATIDVKFDILQGSETGSSVWSETHSNVTTSSLGLFSVKVGSITALDNIDWTAGPYFLKVQLNIGTGFQDFGSSELLSVPYALNSQSVSSLDKLGIRGDAGMDPDSALFEVKRNDGQTVFAVYNSGVRIYVEEETGKGSSRGGFAVGGFRPGKASVPTGEYFRVTSDSVRIYLDDSPGKKSRGGFAVGGFTPGKGTMNQEYLRVTEDRTRIYMDNTATKGSRGGFAVGGFTPGKGPAADFMNLSPENYFIGHESGYSNTSGYSNVFIGNSSGYSNTAGSKNVFLGHNSGYNNKGEGSMGSYNVMLGDRAGFNNDGSYNVFMGYEAGSENTTGNSNIFLGFKAGQTNVTGENNVIIGYGISHKPSSSWNLIIDNTGWSTPLIWGYFQNPRRVVIAGDSTSGNGETFYVNGTAGGLGDWAVSSDERLKKDIVTINNPLDKVMQLRGVEFSWIDKDKYDNESHIGFLAQETKDILPQVVHKNGEYYSMQYAPITALLVEAVKEQENVIIELKTRIHNLESENAMISGMKAEIEQLRQMVSTVLSKD